MKETTLAGDPKHPDYLDNLAGESFVEHLRWPGGLECPECSSKDARRRQKGTGRYICKACSRRWTIRQGTCMDGSRVSLGVWGSALRLHAKGLAGEALCDALVEITGIGLTTAQSLAKRMADGPLPFCAPKAPPTSNRPRNTPAAPNPPDTDNAKSALRNPKLAIMASFASGALIALFFVWAWAPTEPRASEPIAKTTDNLRISYVGLVASEQGGQAHVSYVQGIRVETAVAGTTDLPSDRDRHEKAVEMMAQMASKSGDANSKPTTSNE